MSFENMKQIEGKNIHERSCMLMYHFTPQEVKQILNVARLTGIKDYILLKPADEEKVIREILDGSAEEGEKQEKSQERTNAEIKEKAIIFNGILPQRVSLFIDSLKKCRIPKPLIAVVTEQSINWKLRKLLINLSNERIAIRKGDFREHDQK